MCCSVLQCVAACCSLLQFAAVWPIQFSEVWVVCVCGHPYLLSIHTGVCVACCSVCSVLQCVAVCCSVLQCVTMCCSVLQRVAMCCSVLQCDAVFPVWVACVYGNLYSSTLHTQVCVYQGHANMCVCVLYSQTPVSVMHTFVWERVCVQCMPIHSCVDSQHLHLCGKCSLVYGSAWNQCMPIHLCVDSGHTNLCV